MVRRLAGRGSRAGPAPEQGQLRAVRARGGVDFQIVHLEDRHAGLTRPVGAVNENDRPLPRPPGHRQHPRVPRPVQRPTHLARVCGALRWPDRSHRAVDLISPNCNVFMVVNGHYHGRGSTHLSKQRLRGARPPGPDRLSGPRQRRRRVAALLHLPGRPRTRIDAFHVTRQRASAASASRPTRAASSPTRLSDERPGRLRAPSGRFDTPSGSTASMAWPGRAPSTGYERYAVTTDGVASRTSPTWTFTTVGSDRATTRRNLSRTPDRRPTL